MRISNNVVMTKHTDGTIEVIVNGNNIDTSAHATEWANLYQSCRSSSNRESTFNDGYVVISAMTTDTDNGTTAEVVVETLTPKQYLNRGLTALINFFTEFEFEPNFRFVNTLAYKVAESNTSAKEYIRNYFNLMDNSYKNEISDKMKSAEFNNILEDIKNGGIPTKRVNNRFKIYYGSAGTGKTTLAMNESDKRCIICNASMLPSDLMEDFVFTDGKATFQPSKLWRCMEEGKPIVLDEINLLPFDSLRFLQGILDGKTEFDYKGNKVTIADGFEVIGTMNLSIGGMVYGLPEPLVDRSADMKKFTLTATMLEKAILG